MLDTATAVADLTEAEFRDALRAFLGEHHPGSEPDDHDARPPFQRAWAACLHDHGRAAPSWPPRCRWRTRP